ncbi:hypothetical protein EV424DRAFT_1545600 [Suillus variegatus]|nr:hypothetical protein EV424DRAFT_1545600 [Suillus variegatus]
MSSGAQPSRTKQSNGNHNHIYHPYRQPPCFQEIHTFSGQIGRPDHDNLLGAPDSKMDDVFFRHMDGLSPASCRHVVHYKEAVRERQRMRLFTTYWELEETTRLHALLNSLYAEADLEFRKADREAQFFLKALVTKQSLSRVTSDLDFLTTVRQSNKASLRESDAQLDLIKDHFKPRQSIRDCDNTSNFVAGSPAIACTDG